MNVYRACLHAYGKLLYQPFFPFKTGQLRGSTSLTRMPIASYPIYRIRFDGSLAPYVEYLEEGSRPHDIPHAFGRPLPFGIGGRFEGKFHPGSTKHKGFIKDKSVYYVAKEIANYLGGSLR